MRVPFSEGGGAVAWGGGGLKSGFGPAWGVQPQEGFQRKLSEERQLYLLGYRDEKIWQEIMCVLELVPLKPRPNDRNISTQHIAALLGATCWMRLTTVLRHVRCCWLQFDHFQTRANNTQHVATRRNTVAKRTQHVAPNNVAICCVDMLRSFGRGFRVEKNWATPTKQDLGTSLGFFSKLPTSTPVFF